MFEDMTLEELESLNVRQSSRLSRAVCAGDWMTADIVTEIVYGIRRAIYHRQQAAAVKADPQP